jgi:hypothetical protein
MSNALAIAAVTETLRRILDTGINSVISGTTVTAKPPDKARNGITTNQVNLFLYQTEVNAAWRNMDIPRQVRPGETGRPPLALNLYYLITAYGESDEDSRAHRLLGLGMGLLHDHTLLGAGEIESALADADLHEQVERVRITFQPLNIEEMSKLWTTFQTQYRISAAYQVALPWPWCAAALPIAALPCWQPPRPSSTRCVRRGCCQVCAWAMTWQSWGAIWMGKGLRSVSATRAWKRPSSATPCLAPRPPAFQCTCPA